MPRSRDPNRDRAFEIYRKSGGKIDLVEIASQLNLSPGTIRGWKSKDDWECLLNGTLRKNTERSKRKKGGQPGNKNAVGNNGGAPQNNKNAVTTGEFETLLFDCLEPEEKELAAAVPADKETLLLQEIRLLTVRERRMLKRIENLKADFTAAGKTRYKRADPDEDHATLGQIQNIEDALTRVQARKQAAIDSLHRYGVDDAKLEIDMMRLELASLKVGGQEAELEDDGFLDALNSEAKSLWGDLDGD